MSSAESNKIFETMESLASVADWEVVKQKIKEQNVPLNLFNEVIYMLGVDLGQAFGYSIIKILFEGKDLRDIAEFIYNDLCDQDVYHVSEYLGGLQNIPEVENDINGKPAENSAIFVFGNDADGAKKVAYVLNYLHHEYSLGWDDLILVIATALSNWGLLDPSDRFLQLFLVSVSKELTVDETIVLFQKIIEVCDEEEKKLWTLYNKNIAQFFQLLTSNWNDVDKKQFLKNGPVTWKWSKDSIKQLNKFFKIK
ncbi:hypothetical protein EIN_098550 [Entamoeba invadens IP1]|uniref:Uncharacterized protein n=1 Tax=Entamoeba invadens IP1 TaxID=370355 RepID=A0A0A1U486_ENTIV|nr:hypothetical protein EIN_098550 [Entamoeba invadens IP1]ELP87528.1 hypothetical protein EIN_098550 [Entamoeba invadens IP1]|eukprot:XP_004254299.1 hypothetical protein EIN_098550 [Entamoeba invadens IP1]